MNHPAKFGFIGAANCFLLGMIFGLMCGKYSEWKELIPTRADLTQTKLELTVERMRSDELQRKLDLMTAKDLYYQHAMSNITMMLNHAVRKVEP
jgi:hypothetical protein